MKVKYIGQAILLVFFLVSTINNIMAEEQVLLEASPEQILKMRDKLRVMRAAYYGKNTYIGQDYSPISDTEYYEPGIGSKPINVFLKEFQPTTIQFTDSFGSPWGIILGAKLDTQVYSVEQVEGVADNSTILLHSDKSAGFAILPVFLKDFDLPVLLQIQIDPVKHHQALVIQVRGINKKSERSKQIRMSMSNTSPPMGTDADLNHIVHGVTPPGSKEIQVVSAEHSTRAWIKGGGSINQNRVEYVFTGLCGC